VQDRGAEGISPLAGADLIMLMADPGNDEKPPFLPILGYVLGFMVALAVLAFVAATILRLFR
jgi:hypothetical protein